MGRVRANLTSGLRLSVSDGFGLPAQYKEAIKFAGLARAAQLQLADNIPAASAASRFAILGKLVAAPRLARGAGSMAGRGERASRAWRLAPARTSAACGQTLALRVAQVYDCRPFHLRRSRP